MMTLSSLRKKVKHPEQLLADPESPKAIVEMISYNEKEFLKLENASVKDVVEKFNPNAVNWINIDGALNSPVIDDIGKEFKIHHLMLEDIRNVEHRPKADEYDESLFFTLKMLYGINEKSIDYEHISFVLGKNYLISFQEKEGDIFGALRDRIKLDTGIIRKRSADYLLYRLIDNIVDSYYSVLEEIGLHVETIEENISKNPQMEDFRQIQELKKDFIYLRKVVYPLREALNKIIKNENGCIAETNIKYFSDVYDHVIHLLDSLDTYKDLTSTLMDLYMNTINYKMNEVMKLLTIITSIFIPLSFIAGIYGMNFDNMPELHWRFGYFYVLGFMALASIAMIFYFRYKKWF
jgi:magnesium transporter